MKSLHEKMSGKDFEEFPMRLGWKHEYYGGKIHVTPSKFAAVPLRLALKRRPEDDGTMVRSITEADERRLVSLFVDAFSDTTEYADYSQRDLRQSAHRAIGGFLSDDKKDKTRRASCVALENGNMVGAAFVHATNIGVLLQPLFVRKSHQRRGFATAIMNSAVNRLLALGETTLYSRCHLGNPQSLAWHEKFGFRELPDAWIASARDRYYHLELERHRRLQDLSAPELEYLAKLAAYWEAKAIRLFNLEQRDFRAAHPVLT